MSYSQSIRMRPETLRSLAFGSIGASYAAIGSALAHPSRIIQLYNDTDTGLLFSMDGVNDHWFIPSKSGIVYDLTANKSREQGMYIAEGTIFYVKQSGVPSSGNVYITSLYGSILGS